MRRAMFLIAMALAIAPGTAWTQVSVNTPAAGAASSYRTTVVSWDPIPGASSYRLEIDDDPNFGSPEVDVIVADTSYALSGERLNLNEQLSWAAYVRINGIRWDVRAFTPIYFKHRSHPALAVDSQNKVYLGFEAFARSFRLTTSNNWTSNTPLSPGDTFNAYGLDLAVDENDVAHAFWLDQRPSGGWGVYYTNSATGWELVPVPGTVGGGCSDGSIVVGGGQIDLLHAACWDKIDRWTSTDGIEFTQTVIPNNDDPLSVSAVRDAAGNLFVASDRYTSPLTDRHSSFQASIDGWIPHRVGPGIFPTLAVAPTGVLHVLRWSDRDSGEPSLQVMYSNSLRGFETWTELPVQLSYFNQDLFPLVVDDVHDRLYAAIFTLESGLQLCSAADTGLTVDTGTSWTCASVGTRDAIGPDLALAPDGTLHVAWNDDNGLGYANSLGSFLATNSAPHVSVGPVSNTESAVIIPTTISDVDGDSLSGEIHLARFQPAEQLIAPGTTALILQGRYEVQNVSNSHLYNSELRFRVPSRDWRDILHRDHLPALPATIEVGRSFSQQSLGMLMVVAWDDTGVITAEFGPVPYGRLVYSGALPESVDISALPEGDSILMVSTTDGSTLVRLPIVFAKAAGQSRVMLTSAAAAR